MASDWRRLNFLCKTACKIKFIYNLLLQFFIYLFIMYLIQLSHNNNSYYYWCIYYKANRIRTLHTATCKMQICCQSFNCKCMFFVYPFFQSWVNICQYVDYLTYHFLKRFCSHEWANIFYILVSSIALCPNITSPMETFHRIMSTWKVH